MSIAQKMGIFRAQIEENQSLDRKTELQKMTLQELEKEKIEFGRAKIGQPFPMAFADHKWTDWFVAQYEGSTKEAHQKFIMYVEKRLDQEISRDKTGKKDKTVKKKEASEASWSHVKEEPAGESDEDWGPVVPKMEGESQAVSLLQDQMSHVFLENQSLNHRMQNVENTMHEILHHIKN